jgi:hypothetical protein
LQCPGFEGTVTHSGESLVTVLKKWNKAASRARDLTLAFFSSASQHQACGYCFSLAGSYSSLGASFSHPEPACLPERGLFSAQQLQQQRCEVTPAASKHPSRLPQPRVGGRSCCSQAGAPTGTHTYTHTHTHCFSSSPFPGSVQV